ncbi:hypothetical protein C4D60_Mb10t24360 [Musa balbisiana]|uniref:Uncharacterized protein n=1 Tax=Musa balbisiana TaxID=52838 RepID=A0A4S8IZD8_MUSBA|nr:hypothetical protein C4D60_Mb10t24360 [Musa balbisiana]
MAVCIRVWARMRAAWDDDSEEASLETKDSMARWRSRTAARYSRASARSSWNRVELLAYAEASGSHLARMASITATSSFITRPVISCCCCSGGGGGV